MCVPPVPPVAELPPVVDTDEKHLAHHPASSPKRGTESAGLPCGLEVPHSTLSPILALGQWTPSQEAKWPESSLDLELRGLS